MDNTDIEKLCETCRYGTLTEVKKLCVNNANVNVMNSWKYTPLMLAIYNMSFDIASYLVQQCGASVNVANPEGYTPLHIAAERGLDAIVNLLIDNRASLNAVNDRGHTPIMTAKHHNQDSTVRLICNKFFQAVNCGSQDQVECFLKQGMDINVSNEQQQTALHRAILTQNLPLVKFLVDSGADVHLLDQDGNSPLVLAESIQASNVASQIASCIRRQIPTSLSIEDRCKLEEMTNAIANGSISTIKSLLNDGLDCNFIDERQENFLHLAVRHNKFVVVDYLMANTNIDKTQVNIDGLTPLALGLKLGRRYLIPRIYAEVKPQTKFISRADIQVNENVRLGSGKYGVVFDGIFQGNNVVVKKPPTNGDDFLVTEMELISMCQSPYVYNPIAIVEDRDQPLIVFDAMDCDLRQYLHAKSQGIPPSINLSSLEIALALANALADLHRVGVVHRDLKSTNVIISNHCAKLCDFSTARYSTLDVSPNIGTHLWTAPEVFDSGVHCYSSDIYSFGVLLTELDTLNLPYSHLKEGEWLNLKDEICLNGLRPQLSENCEPWLRDLSSRCMSSNPGSRPTAQEIVDYLYTEHSQE